MELAYATMVQIQEILTAEKIAVLILKFKLCGLTM